VGFFIQKKFKKREKKNSKSLPTPKNTQRKKESTFYTRVYIYVYIYIHAEREEHAERRDKKEETSPFLLERRRGG